MPINFPPEQFYDNLSVFPGKEKAQTKSWICLSAALYDTSVSFLLPPISMVRLFIFSSSPYLWYVCFSSSPHIYDTSVSFLIHSQRGLITGLKRIIAFVVRLEKLTLTRDVSQKVRKNELRNKRQLGFQNRSEWIMDLWTQIVGTAITLQVSEAIFISILTIGNLWVEKIMTLQTPEKD